MTNSFYRLFAHFFFLIVYISILILPLLSFLICLGFGRKVGEFGSSYLSSVLVLFSFILTIYGFSKSSIYNNLEYINLGDWFSGGLLFCKFSLNYDIITWSMLVLVLGISFLVHLFSIEYMKGDPHVPRFMGYLSLFTFFMVILVSAGNLIQLFIGWEGVGLCSYLLINFWYTRIQANKAAIKAMLVNKIGDLSLLLGVIFLWMNYGSWEYSSLFSCSSIIYSNSLLETGMFLLLIAVVGKSAQFGLHTWLPDAMEGPTPVSALIHAATMVTAGVFLIIRLSPLFEKVPLILTLIVLIGSTTAFFSSTIGLVQNDFKKIIAYSTCSQLGYMVLICGFSYYELGLYHLINHGFFKALLFLSAGSMIHALKDEQDFRRGGNLLEIVPISFVCVLVGSASLMGLPFLTGFYSKDLIVEVLYGSQVLAFGFWLAVFSAFLTSIYSFRLIYFCFISEPQESKRIFKKIHEGSWLLIGPLLGLLILATLGGFLLQIYILKDQFPIILPNTIKLITLLVTCLGSTLALFLGGCISFYWESVRTRIFHFVYKFTSSAWYIDRILSYYLINSTLKLGFNITYKLIDNQVLENLGPHWVSHYLINKASFSSYYRGYIHSYLFLFVIAVICFIIQV